MSTKYHKLKVKQIIRETPDTISIYFKQPFFSKIRYKPGQFLTLLVPINGQVERRSYSMSSCPHTEDELCVTVKRVANGKVSNYLNDYLKPGQELEVMEPMGSFHLDLHPVQRHVVLIGAGSGITPLMSIAKAVLRMESTSIVSLLYGNRSEDSIIFKETLDKLQKQFSGRFQVFHILSRPGHSWTGYRGRLSRTLATKLLNELPKLNVHKMDYYLCGPQEMMEEMQETLLAMQVPAEKIHKESFVTTPAASTAKPETEVATSSVIKTEEVTLRYDGSEYKIKVSPNKTILEAGLDSGLDLPYSCQSGLCTACRGKCISGKVKMDEEDGLSPQEIKQGFVLPCVSHPLSPDVVIEIG
jgi:ring-1,2-phenylacetyl-CoA epoxidase subunit PaaE